MKNEHRKNLLQKIKEMLSMVIMYLTAPVRSTDPGSALKEAQEARNLITKLLGNDDNFEETPMPAPRKLRPLGEVLADLFMMRNSGFFIVDKMSRDELKEAFESAGWKSYAAGFATLRLTNMAADDELFVAFTDYLDGQIVRNRTDEGLNKTDFNPAYLLPVAMLGLIKGINPYVTETTKTETTKKVRTRDDVLADLKTMNGKFNVNYEHSLKMLTDIFELAGWEIKNKNDSTWSYAMLMEQGYGNALFAGLTNYTDEGQIVFNSAQKRRDKLVVPAERVLEVACLGGIKGVAPVDIYEKVAEPTKPAVATLSPVKPTSPAPLKVREGVTLDILKHYGFRESHDVFENAVNDTVHEKGVYVYLSERFGDRHRTVAPYFAWRQFTADDLPTLRDAGLFEGYDNPQEFYWTFYGCFQKLLPENGGIGGWVREEGDIIGTRYTNHARNIYVSADGSNYGFRKFQHLNSRTPVQEWELLPEIEHGWVENE